VELLLASVSAPSVDHLVSLTVLLPHSQEDLASTIIPWVQCDSCHKSISIPGGAKEQDAYPATKSRRLTMYPEIPCVPITVVSLHTDLLLFAFPDLR
jgi:hypothetical protein